MSTYAPGLDWTECRPHQAGADTKALDRVLDLVRTRGAVAQLCVLRDGQIVLDRQFYCDAEALFWVFSVSKPFVALLVHLLAERRELALDDSIVKYWPDYARHGKDAITIRQVLTHRAGVPLASGSLFGDALSMTDWRRAVQQAESARPRWPAGQVPAYHTLTYGFILGELVRRITGTSVPELLHREFFGPLGLQNIYLGLPAHLWPRRVPLASSGARQLARTAMFNRRRTRQAVIPAAGISANARDLAIFYQMLLANGRLDEIQVLQSATVAKATQVSSDGEIDQILNRPIRYAHGFQLGGPHGNIRPMGTRANLEAFGHNGSGICNAWADPVRGLVVVYLTNLVVSRKEGLYHQCQVSDAILAALK